MLVAFICVRRECPSIFQKPAPLGSGAILPHPLVFHSCINLLLFTGSFSSACKHLFSAIFKPSLWLLTLLPLFHKKVISVTFSLPFILSPPYISQASEMALEKVTKGPLVAKSRGYISGFILLDISNIFDITGYSLFIQMYLVFYDSTSLATFS